MPTLTISGSPTFGADFCTINSTGADRVSVPDVTLLGQTQMWIAIRFKPSWASTEAVEHTFFRFGPDTNNELFLQYGPTAGTWSAGRDGAGSGGSAQDTHTHAAAAPDLTIIAAWTATTVAMSWAGGVFSTSLVANSKVPDMTGLTLWDIGQRGYSATGYVNADIYWVAAGVGTLTDGNAATIHSLSTINDPGINGFPVPLTFFWDAESTTYAANTPVFAPSAPQALSGVAGDSQVALSWAAPASDGGSAVTAYKIYRGTTAGGESLLASPAGTGTTYTDFSAVDGTTYYYEVTAVNAIGESAFSNEITAQPIGTVSTFTYKRLYGPTQLGNAASTLYTVPVSTRSVIRHIHVSNPTGAPVNFTLSIGTSAAATRLWDATPVAANDVLDHYQDHSLTEGEIIQAFASSAATLNLTVDGYELGIAAAPPPLPVYPSSVLFPHD